MEKEILSEKVMDVIKQTKVEVSRYFRRWHVEMVDVSKRGATIYLQLQKCPQMKLDLVYYAAQEGNEDELKINLPAVGSFDITKENEDLLYFKAVGALLKCKESLIEIKHLLADATGRVDLLCKEFRRKC